MTSITDCTILLNAPPMVKWDISQFIHRVLQSKAILKGTFEFSFLSKMEIQQINQEFLGHDYETDIITFNLSDTPDEIIADIYICTDVAAENAVACNHSVDTEIQTLIIHGILHVMGFLDNTPANRRAMFSEQDRLLSEL